MYTFRTLGNATVQVSKDSHPIISTDPWLLGRAYYDSWALHHPLSEEDISSVKNSDFIWISHGHPDHLHWESLELIPKDKKILVPNLYSDEIAVELRAHGFDVEVLKYREWKRLSEDLEVLCIDNINQDSILLIRAGDSLLINLNDSPLCGEASFIRNIIRQHGNEKVFAFGLCAVAADMMNIVDANEVRVTPPAQDYFPGVVASVAKTVERLGVKYFCCSSSQHIYVRKDTHWLNDYDISYETIKQFWCADHVELVPPFVTCDLNSEQYSLNWPTFERDESLLLDNTGDDDWDEELTDEDWSKLESFMRNFETLRSVLDFVEFKVGKTARRFDLTSWPKWWRYRKIRGIRFIVPRRSLMETVKWGYFDDLLIGNFMKVQPINMTLYPDFSPRIAKFGGNAKVFTNSQLRAFYWHYFRRNPVGMAGHFLWISWNMRLLPRIRNMLDGSPLRPFAKSVYRRVFLGEK